MRQLAAIAALALAGCASARNGQGAGECVPVAGALPAGTSASSLGGSFRLTLVATDGARQGTATTGAITLGAPPAGSTAPSQAVLVGRTDVGLAAVGARSVGRTDSDAPSAPGAAVYASGTSGSPSIVVRFGSLANTVQPAGAQQIEGEYTALLVRQVTPDGFAGTWSSGDGSQVVAAGHFCAVRDGS